VLTSKLSVSAAHQKTSGNGNSVRRNCCRKRCSYSDSIKRDLASYSRKRIRGVHSLRCQPCHQTSVVLQAC